MYKQNILMFNQVEIVQNYWDLFSRWERRLTKYSSCNSLFVCQPVRGRLDRQADEETGQIMKQEGGGGGRRNIAVQAN